MLTQSPKNSLNPFKSWTTQQKKTVEPLKKKLECNTKNQKKKKNCLLSLSVERFNVSRMQDFHEYI